MCVGWGAGSLGVAVASGAVSALVLRYMTDFLAIGAAAGGLLIAASKIYDAITDPVMGIVSDRTSSKRGRRRPFLLAGGLLLALSLVMIFNAPNFSGVTGAMIYMTAALLLHATAYTVFNVPYLAMPAEMTANYHERSYLISFRVYAISFAGMLGLFVGPTIIASFDDGRVGHGVMAWVLAGFVVASTLICFQATRDAPFTQATKKKTYSPREEVALVLQNRPFLVLVGVKLCALLGLAMSMPAIAFFFSQVLNFSDAYLGIYFLSFYIAMMGSQSLWLSLGRRWGKRLTYMVALWAKVAVTMSWLMAGSDEPLVVMLIRAFLLGLTGGGTLLMGQSLLPDTIEYDFRRTGLRREGIFAGVFTTVEKFAYAFAPAITGIFLGAMGYVSSTGDVDAAQPDSAILAIYIAVAIVPSVMSAVAAVLLFAYDLDEHRLKATGNVTPSG